MGLLTFRPRFNQLTVLPQIYVPFMLRPLLPLVKSLMLVFFKSFPVTAIHRHKVLDHKLIIQLALLGENAS